jgi:Rhodanese-like domain
MPQAIDELLEAARARLDRLNPVAAREAAESGALIIDTRCAEARRERQIILVCADGYSSSLAAATLRDLGFSRATDLAGGFNGWVAAGMPVERRRSSHPKEAAAEAPSARRPTSR